MISKLIFALLICGQLHAADPVPTWRGFVTEGGGGSLATNLSLLAGSNKEVTLHLSNGQQVSGTVQAATEKGMVVLSKIKGREFFTGAFATSSIVGVEVRRD